MTSFTNNSPFEIFNAQDTTNEKAHDFTPTTFEEYLGQTELKNKLRVYTQAALQRNEPLDHLLLFGPPGLGKTTLSCIMAHIMKVNIKICSGPMMERTGDLVAILSSLTPRDILFIDEIHRMPTHVEEVLYSAMEQFRVDVILGQGAGAKSINLPLAPFTLIGATTKSGMISAPLRSRFGIVERLDFYTHQELTEIVLQSAQFLQLPITPQGAHMIARASRGTPRIAKKMVRRVRDIAQVDHNNMATDEVVTKALEFLGIDSDGLSVLDNYILKTILISCKGGPVGLETLASLVAEDKETLESVYEPYLIRQGYLEKSARGRMISQARYVQLLKKYTASGNIDS